MKFKVGSWVKFKDNLWEDKRKRALDGGLFGRPLDPNAENKFKISSVVEIDDEETEISLEGYPWLVWGEELEKLP